jgi:hypothetical protein
MRLINLVANYNIKRFANSQLTEIFSMSHFENKQRCTSGYIWPTAVLGQPGRACAFGDEARHRNKTGRVMSYWLVGPEVKPGHGPVAFKRVVPWRRPVGPYCARPVRSPDIQNMVIFPINLVLLVKKTI